MGRDTIQLEDAILTISGEYLLEFTSEYGIPEGLHPELPGPEETIMDFLEGKVGVYTKFFEFANYRIPLSQFLFDILGYYQIHLSQLSVIGAAKVSHFEIICRVLNIIPTLNLFRVFYTPSYNSGWMSFSKRPGKNTPQCYTKPLDSLKNWNNLFFWVDERIFPTVVAWRTSAPKDGMPSADTYSALDVVTLNTCRTPIQKQPELLLCLVGLSRSYFLGDDVYPIFLDDDDREMDLFNLISALNPAKVKTGTRPCAAHEVPLLTATTTHIIVMEDVTEASESLGIPSPARDEVPHEIPLVGNPPTMEVALDLEPEAAAMGSLVRKRRRERGNGGADANAPPKVLRKEYAYVRSEKSTHGGKSLTSMGLAAGSTFVTPTDAKSVSDPDLLSYAEPRPYPEQEIAQSFEISIGNVSTAEVQNLQSAESSESWKSTSVLSTVGLPKGIYQPGWGITNSCHLDTPDACQDVVDHIVLPGYFSELRHMSNADFLGRYNINLAQQVAMGSQLRMRFEQEVRLDQEIQSLRSVEEEVHGLRNRTKNLETLMEAEVDMKRAAEAKNEELTEELESLRVTGEEKIKAAFEDFKKYEDDKVEQWCAEMDARLDALSIDFDEELYPHMLTAIAGHRWVIGHGIRLVVMKCAESTDLRQVFANVVSTGIAKCMSEGLKHGVDHGKANLYLAAIEAYDHEADAKYVAGLSDGVPVFMPTVAPQGLAILLADAATQTETSEDEASPRLIRPKSLPPMYNLNGP
ncbi:hypothetical protein Tco_0298587 [Tanacetum coccineum]